MVSGLFFVRATHNSKCLCVSVCTLINGDINNRSNQSSDWLIELDQSLQICTLTRTRKKVDERVIYFVMKNKPMFWSPYHGQIKLPLMITWPNSTDMCLLEDDEDKLFIWLWPKWKFKKKKMKREVPAKSLWFFGRTRWWRRWLPSR